MDSRKRQYWMPAAPDDVGEHAGAAPGERAMEVGVAVVLGVRAPASAAAAVVDRQLALARLVDRFGA